MRQQIKQRWTGWLLLAAFLPMLLLSSLHTHSEEEYWHEEGCDACVHHQPCAGHLNDGTISLHDCVLCQFLSLPYLTAAVLAAVLYIPFYRLLHQEALLRLSLRRNGVVVLRGPPAVAVSL